MQITKKTAFAIGLVSAGLVVLGGVLLLLGRYVGFVYNVASVAAGAMMAVYALMSTEKTPRNIALLATLLSVLSMTGGVPGAICGALAWPCFALYFLRTEPDGSDIKSLAVATMVAGGIQLVGSFIALPDTLRIVLSIVIGAVQGVFAWLLFQQEKEANDAA